MKLRIAKVVMLGLAICVVAGCASVGETARRDRVTANVGNYPPPPPGEAHPRVGVPPFNIQNTSNNIDVGKQAMENMAADELTTLMFQTNRFHVIERAKLRQLLAEQGLEGIVRPGELAKPGNVRGDDYLLLGKITAFRIKVARTSNEAGVKNGLISQKLLGGLTGGFNKNNTKITTEVGVDLRLVDPSTGEVKAANFSQYKQQDTASGFGIDIAGVGGSGRGRVRISQDDAGKIMRLAFDDAIRKMLPRIDQTLEAQGTRQTSSTAAHHAMQAAGNGAAKAQPVAYMYCPNCGAKVPKTAKFCPKCGAKLQ